MPWRFRIGFVTVIRQRVFSECTKCGSRFSWRELLDRPSEPNLNFYMSGSIAHRECPPTALGLLWQVHQDCLNGYLYSGPTLTAVAKFLGMPEYRTEIKDGQVKVHGNKPEVR